MVSQHAQGDVMHEDSTYESRWSRALVVLHRVFVTRPHARSMPVSRLLYERNRIEGAGGLYRVLPDGLHAMTGDARRTAPGTPDVSGGPFYDDAGLPWCHIRCAAYVPPFSFACVDAVEQSLALPGAFADASIPHSGEIGTHLAREGYRAVLTIRVNSPYSFALLIGQLLDGAQLLEDRVVYGDDWKGPMIAGEIAIEGGWFQPGNPGYYAWRDHNILVMDVGVYDAGT